MRHVQLQLLVLVAGLTACDHDPMPSFFGCSLIGCTNVLTVEVTGAPVQTSITVVATRLDSAVSVVSSQCIATNGSCRVSFVRFTPGEVMIDVSWNSQTKQATLVPIYRISQPNGPTCPPTCRTGMVSLAL